MAGVAKKTSSNTSRSETNRFSLRWREAKRTVLVRLGSAVQIRPVALTPMPRITNSDLEEIFDTDLSTESLDTWIDIANEITNDVAGVDPGLSDSRLEQIELMLSAHYASVQDPRLSSASAETKSSEYRKSENYRTDYMATAVSLDPTGVVANLDKRTARLTVPDSRNIE